MTLRTICFFILIDVITGAQLINCPINNIKLEKILGLRPSNENRPLLLYKNDRSNVPITTECITKCNADPQCRSFVIYYNVSTCYWFRNTIQGVQELNSIIDTDTAWFIKVCLTVPSTCDKLWIIERVPGATLVGNDTKTLPEPLTRTECQQNCLNETSFLCKSAKFRIEANPSNYGPNDEPRGTCILSNADRHTFANGYRVSGFDEEYFENECSSGADDYDSGGNEFCAYEEFENATLSHSDALYEKQDKDSCQKLCEDNRIFNCRGYSLVKTGNNYSCYLHSEDSKLYGPKLVEDNYLGKYYEKAQCVNISIKCTETYMTVHYAPKHKFSGVLYMQGHSEQPECSAKGSDANVVTLKLPLIGTNNQCGIIRANGSDKRILMSGLMVLQQNAFIQTQNDRLIRVGCIFGNDSKVLIGTGITISTAPNRGTTLINTTGTAYSPLVEMRIVDLNTQEEISSTQIGQELQLIIEVSNTTLDLWAGHLVAMTERSDESILLLDDAGCPTNLNIFPALQKIITNNTIQLISNFQAFKFSSSPVVRFSVIVQFCPQQCPPRNCGTNVRSLAINKRSLQSRALDTLNETRIINVNRTQFEEGSRMKLPLEFVMLVRDPTAKADRLIIGDSKILVAGYDYATNEVCLDYSLFIGMIVTWVLIQVVFVVCCIILVRRYKRYYEHESNRQSLEELHKNFGLGFSNLENRRVHWADNRDFT